MSIFVKFPRDRTKYLGSLVIRTLRIGTIPSFYSSLAIPLIGYAPLYLLLNVASLEKHCSSTTAHNARCYLAYPSQ